MVLAVAGTSLVVLMSLHEKESEIALLTVRGFTRRQLFRTLLGEIMTMVLFSLVLGLFVGVVGLFGNASLLNSQATGLIRSRVVMGGMSGLVMLGIVAAVPLAAIVPVWWVSREPETKVDLLRV